MTGVEIRALDSHREFDELVRLEKAVWGADDIEVTSTRMQVVIRHVGGQILGAFDGSSMIGFCLALPGVKPDGQVYLHSDMLGVLPEHRDRGVGRALKLVQRADALRRGIRLIEWTFDPLQLKNAYFNLERLGAVVRRYLPDHYGPMRDHIQGGLRSDRCIAEWHLDSPWVEAALGGRKPEVAAVRRVDVETAIGELRFQDVPRACAIQDRTRDRLNEAFASGLAAVGFERGTETGAYLLGEWTCG